MKHAVYEQPLLLQKIEEMYAFVSQDEKGGEGIIGYMLMMDGQKTMMPLVGADMARMNSFMPIAQEIADKLKTQKVKLIKFTNRVELQDIEGIE